MCLKLTDGACANIDDFAARHVLVQNRRVIFGPCEFPVDDRDGKLCEERQSREAPFRVCSRLTEQKAANR